ncbi:hypothetical protein CUMW_198360, partial [Citrus unshiu]
MVQILVQNYFYAPPICAAYAGESATPANAPRNPLVAVLSNCALDSSFVFNPVMGSSLIQQISLLRLCLWRSKSISKRERLLGISDEKIMGDLNQCSSVKSMDFHPVQQTLLF